MLSTIYNILMILICTLLYYVGYTSELTYWYFIMMIIALVCTTTGNKNIKQYPNVSPDYHEAINTIFTDTEYKLRYVNLLVSGAIHGFIAVVLLNNVMLFASMMGVMLYRGICLVSNKKLVDSANE